MKHRDAPITRGSYLTHVSSGGLVQRRGRSANHNAIARATRMTPAARWRKTATRPGGFPATRWPSSATPKRRSLSTRLPLAREAEDCQATRELSRKIFRRTRPGRPLSRLPSSQQSPTRSETGHGQIEMLALIAFEGGGGGVGGKYPEA